MQIKQGTALQKQVSVNFKVLKVGEEKIVMIFKEWEMFFTDSKQNDELVDQISINVSNKTFLLDTNAQDLVTDGYDENDQPIVSYYVSRFMFDLIVESIKAKGFKEIFEY